MGNERGSSSSRKGKKMSEKPKQAQRGLGVAQLENIRLHGQMPACSYVSYPPAAQPGVINHNDRYIDLQLAPASSWVPNINNLEAQHFMQSNMAGHMMFNVRVEDSLHLKGEKCKSRSMGSGSQNSNSSDNHQELDLELRLSL